MKIITGFAVLGLGLLSINTLSYVGRNMSLTDLERKLGQRTACISAMEKDRENPLLQYTILYGVDKAAEDFIYGNNCEQYSTKTEASK